MTDAEFAAQWDLDTIPACETGLALLKRFAELHPEEWPFVRPADLVLFDNPAFATIPEWDAFARHYAGCPRCNEA